MEITAVKIDGVGGSTCDVDWEILPYSWFVTFSDGTHGHYCSNHCPGIGDTMP